MAVRTRTTYVHYSSRELKAPEEACSPPRRTSSSSKHKIYELFPYSELCLGWIRLSLLTLYPILHFDADPDPAPR